MRILPCGYPLHGTAWFTLTAGSDNTQFLLRSVLCSMLCADYGVWPYAQKPKFERNVYVFTEPTSKQHHFPSSVFCGINCQLDAVDIGGEGGDKYIATAVCIYVGKNRGKVIFRGTKSRLLHISG